MDNVNACFVPSPITELCQDILVTDDGDMVVNHRDIICLLETKKLEQLDPQVVKDVLNSVSETSEDPISIDDEQLVNFCKSRYINNLTDISNYSNMLESEKVKISDKISSLKRSFEDYISYNQSLSTDKSNVTDTVKS